MTEPRWTDNSGKNKLKKASIVNMYTDYFQLSQSHRYTANTEDLPNKYNVGKYKAVYLWTSDPHCTAQRSPSTLWKS